MIVSGYIGHIASRHSETLTDSSPVLTHAQIESSKIERNIVQNISEVKYEPNADLAVPKTAEINYQATVVKEPIPKNSEVKRPAKSNNGKGRCRGIFECPCVVLLDCCHVCIVYLK